MIPHLWTHPPVGPVGSPPRDPPEPPLTTWGVDLYFNNLRCPVTDVKEESDVNVEVQKHIWADFVQPRCCKDAGETSGAPGRCW